MHKSRKIVRKSRKKIVRKSRKKIVRKSRKKSVRKSRKKSVRKSKRKSRKKAVRKSRKKRLKYKNNSKKSKIWDLVNERNDGQIKRIKEKKMNNSSEIYTDLISTKTRNSKFYEKLSEISKKGIFTKSSTPIEQNNLLMVALSQRNFIIDDTYHQFIKNLIDEGEYINYRNRTKMTPLMFASMYTDANIVALLLKNGAIINNQDEDGKTALMKSVEYAKYNIAELLLERGANINIRSKREGTALSLAILLKNQEMIKILLEYNADYNSKESKVVEKYLEDKLRGIYIKPTY